MATRRIFVARFTECPEYDIERDWSAWMDYEGETKGELIDSYRSEHPDANLRKLRVGYHKVYKRWVVIGTTQYGGTYGLRYPPWLNRGFWLSMPMSSCFRP